MGCLSIIITNEKLFADFARQVYNANKETEEFINDTWKETVTNVTLGTPEASVGKLINFFNETNAGLSAMFRSMSSENKGNHQNENWSAKDVDTSGNYIDKNCN